MSPTKQPHHDLREIAQKIQDLVENPPPEVTERMRRQLQKSRRLTNPPDIDNLLANRY